MTDKALIARGAELAGSQNKLALAIGYSARVLSNANHGTPLSDDARARIILYLKTGKPVAVPGPRLRGRKPAAEPVMGIVTLGFAKSEWDAIRDALDGESMRGWVSRVVRDWLAERRVLPQPKPLPENVVRRRQRLDGDVIAALTRRGRNVEARPCYVRMAVLAELEALDAAA